MKALILSLLVQCLVYLTEKSDAYKILGIFPTAGKSHYLIGSALMKGLVEEGHEVVMISPYTQNPKIRNYREVRTQTVLHNMLGETHNITENLLDMRKLNTVDSFYKLFGYGEEITNKTFQEDSVQELLRSKEKFDIIVMEVFANEAMLGFAHRFQAPVIGVSTFVASYWICEMTDSPSPPSFVSSPFSRMTHRMNIFERVENFLTVASEKLIYDYFHIPRQEALYNQYFPEPKPKLRDLIRSVSAVLINSHFTLSYPRPYSVNMIEVGGLHVDRRIKPLSAELNEFIDSAKDGVIYFSMGSNIYGKMMDMAKVNAFLNVFASLKQKVIWKFEHQQLPRKISNVLIGDWFPQNDILAHPNVKLFITHGGLLSITEATYHGVPVLVIPIFADQPWNSARVVSAGVGKSIDYDQMTENSLREAIFSILQDNSYEENAKLTSARFRDRPLPPLETAIYWVEYVAKHKGAPHLHSAGLELNLFQYYNLDIFSFCLLTVLVALYLMFKAISIISSFITFKDKSWVKDNAKKLQ